MAARKIPGGGRPRGAGDGGLRDHVVKFHLSASEFARLARAAGDIPPGEFCRDVVLAACPTIAADPIAIRDALAAHVAR